MIRTATLNDRFHMLRMAKAFVQAADMSLPFDAVYAERSAKLWIEDDARLALVLDLDGVCGMLCASSVESPLAPLKIGIEQVFWIDPTYRGRWAVRLIAAYEAWAVAQGCDRASLATIQAKGADRLYARLGYERAETHFVKEL